jgi:hypothetical protein
MSLHRITNIIRNTNILRMITISLEITLVFEESRNYIIKFIANHKEPVSEQAIIDYMESKEVPAQFRTSRVTTSNIIKELEAGKRILQTQTRERF